MNAQKQDRNCQKYFKVEREREREREREKRERERERESYGDGGGGGGVKYFCDFPRQKSWFSNNDNIITAVHQPFLLSCCWVLKLASRIRT